MPTARRRLADVAWLDQKMQLGFLRRKVASLQADVENGHPGGFRAKLLHFELRRRLLFPHQRLPDCRATDSLASEHPFPGVPDRARASGRGPAAVPLFWPPEGAEEPV